MRLRHEYKEAEAACLAILKRYPNNASAHMLLGDIAADQADLEQATTWYELALDLAHDHPQIQQKLEAIQARKQQAESVHTVEQLGIPPSSGSRAMLWTGLALGVMLFGGILLYAFRPKSATPSTPQPILPVEVPSAGTASPHDALLPPPSNPSPPPRELSLAEKVASGTIEGTRILSVHQDPRTQSLLIEFDLRPSDDPILLGAALAKAAFEQIPGSLVVTLRGITRETLVFVADARRSRLEETLTEPWRSRHFDDPDAWADHLLTDIWEASSGTPMPQMPSTGGDTASNPPPGDGF